MRLASAIVVISGLVCACSIEEEGRAPGGEFRVGLFGEGASGQAYRLRDAIFDVDGLSLSSEGLPDGATTQTAILAAGDYTVALQDGWRVERELANGEFLGVEATLSSANPVDFSIDVSTTTNVTYVFTVDGDGPVEFNQGTLEIDVDFDDADADCPDENADGFCDACGDDIVTAGEECDGSDLAGESCVSFGFSAGTLSCNSDCTYSTAGCSSCGDGVVDPSEECEPPGSVISSVSCGVGCLRFSICTLDCQIDPGFCECF